VASATSVGEWIVLIVEPWCLLLSVCAFSQGGKGGAAGDEDSDGVLDGAFLCCSWSEICTRNHHSPSMMA
jgi:hypothetical protein